MNMLKLLFLTMLAGALGACTSSFDAKWRAAATRKAADPYTGRYAGEWRSTRGTHRDKLEGILTKTGALSCTADFHAHWHGLSSSYTVTLKTAPAPGGLAFRGEKDLGALQGGVYKYEGTVTAHRWQATYDSKYDTGVFDLQRVP